MDFAVANGANLEEANLRGASIKGTDFTEANLQKGDFCYAKTLKTNFRGAQISGANFNTVSFKDCLCFDLNFAEASFYPEDRNGAKFLDSDWLKNRNSKKLHESLFASFWKNAKHFEKTSKPEEQFLLFH